MNTIEKITFVQNELNSVGDEIERFLASIPIDDLIMIGLGLWKIEKRVKTVFEKIKIRFRDEAITRSNGKSGSIVFGPVERATAHVAIPVSKPTIKKGADMGTLRSRIGDKFTELFEETTVWAVRKDFAEVGSNLTPEEASAVMTVIEMTDGTPSVYLKG